jgi:hypothetical protein
VVSGHGRDNSRQNEPSVRYLKNTASVRSKQENRLPETKISGRRRAFEPCFLGTSREWQVRDAKTACERLLAAFG